jgi:predicted MFS family arabinose efflux permease
MLAIPGNNSRSFRLYALALFAMFVGNNIPAPLFQLFRRDLGVTPDGLALLYAGYAVAVIATLPVLGRLSDRIGRRNVVMAGLALNALGAVLLALADGLPVLVAGRLLQGISVSAVLSPAAAALAELAPPQVSGKAALAFTLALAVGGSLGPLAGGGAADFSPWPQSLALLTYAGAVVLYLPVLLTADDPAPPSQPGSGAGMRLINLPGAFWWTAGAIFVSNAVQNTLYAMGGPRLADVLPDRVFIATGVGIVAFMLASIGGQFAGRALSPRYAIGVGLALTSFGLVVLARGLAAASYKPILLAMLISGAAHGLVNLGAAQRINELAPPEHRSLFNAVFNVARYLGTGIPVLAVGILARSEGLAGAFGTFSFVIYAATAALLLLGMALQIPKRGHPRRTGRLSVVTSRVPPA